MTVLEQYKQEIDELTYKLDNNIGCFSCSEEVLELVEQASAKLKEMMRIVEDVGIANGVMADALKIMMKQ